MCELLGMSANVPTDICFSFSGLMQRGGQTGPHTDGWGIAFYEDRGCRLFHDPAASADSEIARLIGRYSIKSCTVISHIRQATHGRVSLENTHPFRRELWGRPWVFAHNGKLPGVKGWPLGMDRPIGTTDSEHAFCWLMAQLRERFPRRPSRPETVWRYVFHLATELSTLGTFNMLMSDGRVLYAFCGTHLSWITRRAPFGAARLKDAEMEVDFSRLTTPNDVVTVIATHPLTTNEVWQTMTPGSMVVFQGGLPTLFDPAGRLSRPQESP
ncbi:class II glutamine amidotransferase [Alkalilimnicola sp. S0819]|uniref:class II glutamine amidotransferase n=1 Tax=Alkalilimnicola sp. S0819 TaxID=2613922 RepID=UPI001262388A|nr:class II glutamine amidotransferase [Alkalilimnicola sp. S0819]KAB7619700.1 class II glutamine amidotransferase [Alkalilimnicola sp. S0819]MPQ17558.1 class II glutamine amidotransferase [Alkalilimnicola sp. S0819]